MSLFSLVSVVFAGFYDYVDFNDGEEHVIDYYVKYSPEIPDCSVRVDNDVNNVPGTHLILESGARIDYELLAYNNSLVDINGGNVWGAIGLYGNSHLNLDGGIANGGIIMANNSSLVMLSGMVPYPRDINVRDEAELTIKGGALGFGVYSDSKCIIEGGNVSNLIAQDTSNNVILGGHIDYILSEGGYTEVKSGTIYRVRGYNEGHVLIEGGIILGLDVQHYHIMELIGDFKVKKPSTGEISDKYYYGSLANPEISDYIVETYNKYYHGILIGSFMDGIVQEIPYYIYCNSPDWTCNITLFPIIDIINVLTPNGGEIFPVGTTKTITWKSEGKVSNVQLSYSSDNGSTWNTIKTVSNTGSTTWSIPNTPSSECLLKISDADDPEIFDISDGSFTIQSAYPVVTSPNGGEQFYTGTERTIYWNTVGAISSILIGYSTDNGLNWTPVEPANVGNTKSYKWKVPHAVSEQCLIRVSDAANPSSYDVSNASFSILPSKPNLLIPNGAENLLTGSVFNIRWTTIGTIQNIAIEYSINNGSSWQPVNPANTGNTGHYSWTVPYQVSDQCLIRISNADHPEVYDVSELPFQIVSSLPALLSPNGGEQLLSGTTTPIQWNTTGSISDILIEYSLDNGATWIAVTPPNTENTGTYDWTVPYVMSKECLIRVSDASHPVVNDTSDVVFEISPLYLKTPNGGEKMLINSLSKIYWDSGETLSGDLISLQYSTNKGQDWVDLGTTENDGQYEWSVPQIESNQYLIQITDVNTPEYSRISQGTFVVYRCYEQIVGDLDGDCLVGLSDFAVIAENWLNQGKVLVKNYSMDETPNWTIQGQWEFGQPLGLGGSSYGNPDPNSGYTGINVYGINLAGDYTTAIGEPYYLTTGAIDCSHFEDIKVSFMSRLNIDGSNYAQCKFEVSINGTDWVTLWNNTPEPVTDNDWNKMEFDISEYADDNPTLYLRWGYQIIDRAYPYSGWNIDDVELWGTL